MKPLTEMERRFMQINLDILLKQRDDLMAAHEKALKSMTDVIAEMRRRLSE